MRVLGVDFTSAPRRGKPITCLDCLLADGILQAGQLVKMTSFEQFEQALRAPGAWIAGIDFPFGQSRKFIENMGWPRNLGRLRGSCAEARAPRFSRRA